MKADQEKQINFILAELRNGSERATILQKFTKSYKSSTKTFDNRLKIAKERFSVESERINKQTEQVLTDVQKDALKSGLKSKLEKQLSLQNQIAEIEKILESGITPDTIIDVKTSSSFDIERKLTAIERSHLMKTLRELTAELNKMAGDYAVTKSEVTVKGEQPLFPDNINK